MMIAVRPAKVEDAPVLAEMLTLFNGARTTPEQVLARLAATRGIEMTFLAEVDGQVAGLACLRLVPYMSDDRPYAELTELYVGEAYRRQGVASALLQRVEALARARGAVQLLLLTGLANTEAQTFYRAMGYRDYGLAMYRQLEGDVEP